MLSNECEHCIKGYCLASTLGSLFCFVEKSSNFYIFVVVFCISIVSKVFCGLLLRGIDGLN